MSAEKLRAKLDSMLQDRAIWVEVEQGAKKRFADHERTIVELERRLELQRIALKGVKERAAAAPEAIRKIDVEIASLRIELTGARTLEEKLEYARKLKNELARLAKQGIRP